MTTTRRERCDQHGYTEHFVAEIFGVDGGTALFCPECYPVHPDNPRARQPAADMRALPVIRTSLYLDTIFVPLPRSLWRPMEICSCAFCVAHPDLWPYWDTLALSTLPPRGEADITWLVHKPEAHQKEK